MDFFPDEFPSGEERGHDAEHGVTEAADVQDVAAQVSALLVIVPFPVAEHPKAHRRGKVGWDVGRQVEVMPHYRRPHLMLAWTGPGRAVPKIVPRRGSIVHRSAVEKVPSGFGGNLS